MIHLDRRPPGTVEAPPTGDGIAGKNEGTVHIGRRNDGVDGVERARKRPGAPPAGGRATRRDAASRPAPEPCESAGAGGASVAQAAPGA
ncbi:hypothetical protein P2H44_19360 [Albimonas sp. CAU 1670]|uniref:hypothetical protein n=1 Tax=Albimonas sp. CAU 1670 TaxID=3032599 RepID=UPI0023DABE9B|nr:hypothetical protein [Albimonas sp. CAU 1670]MDF2234723.1 hypothetical protein [Albimonas sp. CAU 1670]